MPLSVMATGGGALVSLLTQAAYHAFVLATTFGYLHLAQLAAQRAFDAARVADRPELEASRCSLVHCRWRAPADDSGQCACWIRRSQRQSRWQQSETETPSEPGPRQDH